jgi:hypothetical protein
MEESSNWDDFPTNHLGLPEATCRLALAMALQKKA